MSDLDLSKRDGVLTFPIGGSKRDGCAYDSIELRDGSVLNGDLVSISGMDVEIRVGGDLQHIDRNRIKRIMLVQRDAPRQDLPPASASQPRRALPLTHGPKRRRAFSGIINLANEATHPCKHPIGHGLLASSGRLL
jgi:hypothetical protein